MYAASYTAKHLPQLFNNSFKPCYNCLFPVNCSPAAYRRLSIRPSLRQRPNLVPEILLQNCSLFRGDVQLIGCYHGLGIHPSPCCGRSLDSNGILHGWVLSGGGSQTSGSGNDSFQIIFVAWKQILSIIAHCLQVDICNL